MNSKKYSIGKLFEALKTTVRAQDWFASLVQFIIVVLGVAIGFQITSWNEERKTNAQGADYSWRLAYDLGVEVETSGNLIGYYEVVRSHGQRAMVLFDQSGLDADRDLLISAYSASQYVAMDQIDATYQALVSQGSLALVQPDNLSVLAIRHYTSNNKDNLSELARTSAFRERLRRAMPSQFQEKIREQCGDIRDEKGFVVGLPQDCEVNFGSLDTTRAASILRNDNALKADLALFLGTLESYIEDSKAARRLLTEGLAEINSSTDLVPND